MTRVRLNLLGRFEARPDPEGPPAALGRKAQGLVGYLAVRPGQPHHRERLAALLWRGMEDEQARHSLRQAVFAIRRALPALALVTAGDTLALDPAAVEVDVVEMEALAETSTVEALERAAALYRGDLLEGLRVKEPVFEDWLARERQRLRAVACTALEKLTSALVQGGETDRAAETAQRLLALDPARETAHRALIRLHLAAGRRADAVRQYQACERALRAELGVGPEAETRRLIEDVADERRPAPEAPSPARDDRAAVLVVEDEPVTRALLEAFLGSAGYRVEAVVDGGDALLRVSRERFDLIVSDIAMPLLDGMTLLEILARNRITTPVIFVTAQPGDELEVRGLQLGAVDYLRKPVQKDVLLARVQRALARSVR